MFYCPECRKKNNWPEGLSISRGKCEICGHIRNCYDVPSSQLPIPPRKHSLVTHINCRKEGNCDICDGGLAICKVCGGAEGSLPEECPGEKMSTYQDNSVFMGILGYKGGEWVGRVSKLDNGKIPSYTECPFTDKCYMAKKVKCIHGGVKHKVPFNCTFAVELDKPL